MALFFYKEKNKDIRAAAYLRLSIEDGDKAESNSIGNQRELIRDFAAERPGLHLVEEYADDGYTGTNFERPGFKRMMEDIKSGKINCIIVKDLSRLGRNYIEMGKYLEQIFPMMGIRFIAINDNYDNANTESSDSDSIVVPFKNLLNDSYCRDISIKVRSQLDMKRRKGEFIGGYAIYGYCKDERNKNRLVVDEYSDRKNDEKARTAFDQMTNDGVERKFDCIIVASMYYCGPDFPAARQAIEETLYAAGIDLIVLEESLDTRAVSRKEVEDYFEAKRCEMHAEIMFAWRRKQGAGFRLTNSVPFGYIRRNGESNMVKDEEVAPYLSEAFFRYASGQKMRDIAKWLNEQGVEPPMKHKKRILGKPYDAEPDQWTTDMLRCLFRNPTYTGATANGSRQIIAENCHEPYITKEQFYAFPCNMREGENKISIRKSYKKPNPLAKHIVCTCGHALCWHKDKRTGEELFYCRYCRAHKENGKNLKVPAATIYKKVMDALELEHLEEEKLAVAIQQGAGKKAIEVVRAEKSLQMKSVLAELNMEQFRRVPLYESYMADEITEEQYRAELLDYEEAHRKLNEQLTAIMEDTLVWERALSLRNPWIQQMAQYKTPEELDRNFVKKYIEQVTVTLLDDGQAEISLTMKTDEWKQMLSRIEVEGTDSGTKE